MASTRSPGRVTRMAGANASPVTPVFALSRSDWEALREEIKSQRDENGSLRTQLAAMQTLMVMNGALSQTEQKPPPPLESEKTERERQLAKWDSEPRVRVYIAPTDDDRRAQKEMGEYPPMIFQVNGVLLAVPKGKQTELPESVALQYEYMLNPWAAIRAEEPVTFDQTEARMGVVK